MHIQIQPELRSLSWSPRDACADKTESQLWSQAACVVRFLRRKLLANQTDAFQKNKEMPKLVVRIPVVEMTRIGPGSGCLP